MGMVAVNKREKRPRSRGRENESVRPSVSHRNGVNEDVFHLTSSRELVGDPFPPTGQVDIFLARQHVNVAGPVWMTSVTTLLPWLDGQRCFPRSPFHADCIYRWINVVSKTLTSYTLYVDHLPVTCLTSFTSWAKKKRIFFFSDSFRYFIFDFISNGNLVKRSKVFDLFLDRIHLLFLPV